MISYVGRVAVLALLAGCAAPIRYGSPHPEAPATERQTGLEITSSRRLGHGMPLTGSVLGSDALCGKDGPCMKAGCIAGLVFLLPPLAIIDGLFTGWEINSTLHVKGLLLLTAVEGGRPRSGAVFASSDGYSVTSDARGEVPIFINRDFATNRTQRYRLIELRPATEAAGAPKVIRYWLQLKHGQASVESEVEPPGSDSIQPRLKVQ